MKNTVCPYTLKTFAEVEASREHVIPDALGGPNGFAVRASRTENSELGRSIDVSLIDSPVVRMCSSRLGIGTRSGPSELNLRGTLKDEGSPVDVTMTADSATFRLRSPVVKDNSGNLVGVRGFGEDAKKELQRLQANHSKKGMAVQAGPATPADVEIHVRIEFNREEVLVGLLKIAYLANVWLFGDEFIQSDSSAPYRAWLAGRTDSDDGKRLRQTEMDYRELAECVPDATSAHHLIVCTRSEGQVTTVVRLFGEDLLSANFTTPDSMRTVPHNEVTLDIIAVNATTRELEQLPTVRVAGGSLPA